MSSNGERGLGDRCRKARKSHSKPAKPDKAINPIVMNHNALVACVSRIFLLFHRSHRTFCSGVKSLTVKRFWEGCGELDGIEFGEDCDGVAGPTIVDMVVRGGRDP